MEFYVISPLSQLELMGLGDRIFVLAQLYLRSEKYREYIKGQKELGKFLTLDNGTGDFDPVSEQLLLDCVHDLMPNEVIAPDILFNKDKTIKNAYSFKNNLPIGVNLFVCPQGNTLNEWIECYSAILPIADVVGLSKITIPWIMFGVKKDRGIAHSRNLMYNLLKERGLIKKPIHCLGAGEPWEFKHYKNDPLIRSVDSCFTVWAAMNGIRFDGDYDRITTPKDYFDRGMTLEQIDLAKENIQIFRKILTP